MKTSNQSPHLSPGISGTHKPMSHENSGLQILDERRFRVLAVEHPGVMLATTRAFLKLGPGLLEELMRAVVRCDHQHALATIHKLKSSVFIFASSSLLKELDDLKAKLVSSSSYELMDRTICIKESTYRLCSEIIRSVSQLDLNKTRI